MRLPAEFLTKIRMGDGNQRLRPGMDAEAEEVDMAVFGNHVMHVAAARHHTRAWR